ncbi:ATP-dependent DNA helicase RecG [Oceanirhabdus seepicola]|uniref:ATP-dependent DNA helicase RecG n=1 Tax=Oceanirhabdus seepicola TaxID=2828781 RepID=A0A9J6P6E8_9CLOT|nr:ATP-dependent DNA helicase RecG [Oceanirhabdus seepicola]MCM1991072.1 ATP-dependent DNA helicase RecG [Oceanirhabdus seepicola]
MNLTMDIKYLKGVGPKMKEELNKAGVFSFLDLLLYFPRDYESVDILNDKSTWIENSTVIVEGVVKKINRDLRIRNNMTITSIKLENSCGEFYCKWFNMPYIKNNFKIGSKYVLKGKVYNLKGDKGLNNAKVIRNSNLDSMKVVSKYNLRGKLTNTFLNKIITELVNNVDIQENISKEIIKRYNLISLKDAIINIHCPQGKEMLIRAKERLKFQELFTYSLKILSLKKYFKCANGIQYKICEELSIIKEELPFELTGAQRRTLREILLDQKNTYPMNRLVQGDVGSGKTIVAIISMLNVVKNGYQASMMAPTEILARQHYNETCALLKKFGINIELLVGSTTKKNKEIIKEKLKEGKIDIIIGTHALIEDNVEFNKVGLVVTDEQHRFGVNQRCRLSNKEENVDVLVMTATPIPRTLSLYLYGDLDVSIIDELPKGRKEIKTRYTEKKQSQKAYEFALNEIKKGRQVYIVCPLVEENEEMKLTSVEEHFKELQKNIFKDVEIEILHGKMKAKEKELVMNRFKNGEIKALISTTVIEVGVNVPNATVMIIENAERFGLSQLHQLRGRVGRGEHQSYCILVPEVKSEVTRRRMEIMVESNDGFYISEQDLKIRGTGELFGIKQSGEDELLLANLREDMNILRVANKEAQMVIDSEDMEHIKMKKEILRKLSSSSNYICYN